MTDILNYFGGLTDSAKEKIKNDPEFKKEMDIRDSIKNDFSDFIHALEKLYGEGLTYSAMLNIASRYLIMYVAENKGMDELNALRRFFNESFDEPIKMVAAKESFETFKKEVDKAGGMKKMIDEALSTIKDAIN